MYSDVTFNMFSLSEITDSQENLVDVVKEITQVPMECKSRSERTHPACSKFSLERGNYMYSAMTANVVQMWN